MERRTVLTALGSLAPVGLGGCLGLGDGDGRAGETAPNQTATTARTTTERDPTVTEAPTTMRAGTTIAAVQVHRDFEGEVRFTADCRETEVLIPSGERIDVHRSELGEACEVTLAVDGETVLDREIGGYASADITVAVDGEMDMRWTVI